jgi:hypothetical protein
MREATVAGATSRSATCFHLDVGGRERPDGVSPLFPSRP